MLAIRIFENKNFFIFILAIVIFQGLWYALSFGPFLFDESRHFTFISLYSEHLNPIISIQTPAVDALGQVAREPSYLYYYIMSIPLRIIKLFTADPTIHLILLRCINLSIFVGAIILYKKAFLKMGIKEAVVNIALLFFILIPSVAPLAGVVSYDVGALILLAIILMISARMYRRKNLVITDVVLFLSTAFLSSVIKYTVLPFILGIGIALVLRLYSSGIKSQAISLRKSFIATKTGYRIALGGLLLFSIVVFVERPVQNLIQYKSLNPSCFETLPKQTAQDRCTKNYVYERNVKFLAAKPATFKPANPIDYFLGTWVPGMVVSSTRQVPAVPFLPVVTGFFYTALIFSVVVVLLAAREILSRNRVVWIMIITSIVYIGAVYYSNYTGYVRLGQPVAVSARYLMPIIPLVLILVALSVQALFPRFKNYFSLLVLVIVIVLTQGGGLVGYVLHMQDTYYLKGNLMHGINHNTQKVLRHLVKE